MQNVRYGDTSRPSNLSASPEVERLIHHNYFHHSSHDASLLYGSAFFLASIFRCLSAIRACQCGCSSRGFRPRSRMNMVHTRQNPIMAANVMKIMWSPYMYLSRTRACCSAVRPRLSSEWIEEVICPMMSVETLSFRPLTRMLFRIAVDTVDHGYWSVSKFR